MFRPAICALPHSRYFTPAFIGALYGALIWFVGGILIAPVVTNVPAVNFALGDLFCWLLYGLIVALTHEAKRSAYYVVNDSQVAAERKMSSRSGQGRHSQEV